MAESDADQNFRDAVGPIRGIPLGGMTPAR